MEETVVKSTAERYNNSIERLEESIRKARLYNDKLSQQLFVLNNRANNVAHKIGFNTFDDFEEAVLDEPEMWNLEAIRSNHLISTEPGKDHGKDNVQNHTPDRLLFENIGKQVDRLKQEISHLKQYAGKDLKSSAAELKEPCLTTRFPLTPLKSTANASLPPEESSLRVEFNNLSHKYDVLVAAKKSAEEKYKKDYRKWKTFKSWLLTKSKHSKAIRARLAKGNFDFDEDLGEDLLEGHDEKSAKSRGQLSNPARSTTDENNIPISSASTPPLDGTPDSKGWRLAQGSEALRPADSPALFSMSDSDSPPHEERVPLRESLEVSDRAASANKDNQISMDVHSASCEKKGRYSTTTKTNEGINNLFAINPSRNNGLPFQYDEVVRNKELRKRLEAGDCDCCREYYNCVAPLPSRLEPPAWLSPPSKRAANDAHRDDSTLKQGKAESHKKQISRHRHRWSPAKTPPDYWNIGFPTTQQVADINKRANEMHEEKRRRIENEANMESGRYIKRARN